MLVFVAGIVSYINLPKQESPDISVPVAIVSCVYPGASQEDVEKLVTKKIEDELKDMEGYLSIKSFSMNSYVTLIFELDYGVDVDESWGGELRTKMVDLQDELPEECHTVQVRTDLTETAGMIIAISGDDYSYDELAEFGEKFITKLSAIDGIRRFELNGNIDKEVIVELNHYKMNRLNLSYSEVLNLIQSQNIEIPSGIIEEVGEGGKSLIPPLNSGGSFESIDEIGGDLILAMSSEDQSVLRLKDIGQVTFGESDRGGIKYKSDGQPAVLLSGYFQDDQNVLLIGEDVREVIQTFIAELPSDLVFREVVFQPNSTQKSINNFMINLLQGILLVILVVFIGMGFRNAIIVSLAIPLAIVMTFLKMPLFGVRVHEISIVGLIVALGMLVDNAIVVSDSIQYKLDRGIERLEAAVEGAKEVLIPVFSSTLTTVATLIPLLLLNSTSGGDFIRGLPMVVILALSASFLIAIVITPTFAYIFFRPRREKVKPLESSLGYNQINYVMAHRTLTFIGCILLLIVLGLSITRLDVIFFPKADKEIMYINVEADQNVDKAYTESVVNQVERVLDEAEGVTHYTTSIGGGIPKFYSAMVVYQETVQNAQIMFEVDLEKKQTIKKNTPYADYLQTRIDASLIGGKATVKELENAMPIDAPPITLRLSGTDFNEIKSKANQLLNILNGIEGTKNVRSDYQEKRLEYTLDIDEKELAYLGLTKYDVLNEVSIALRGRKASTFRRRGKEYDIILQGDKATVEGIENTMIKSSITNNKNLLRDIGRLELVEQLPIINKYNGEYSISVMSDIRLGYQRDGILEEFNNEYGKIDFKDITVKFDGEVEKIKENFGSAGMSAMIAICIIYAILLVQFRSYYQPLIILFTVPLSAVGALFGLFVMGQPISFTGLIGIISLIGIVVNNAIVLLDYINLKRKEGMTIVVACKQASLIRLRPILLSTITTISGLLPLLIGNSELFKPMAVALVFGLLISTMLTLVFIPLTYSIFIRE